MNQISKKLILPLINGDVKKVEPFVDNFFEKLNIEDYVTSMLSESYKQATLDTAFNDGIDASYIDFGQLLQELQTRQKEQLEQFIDYLYNNDNYDKTFQYLFLQKILKSTEKNKKRSKTSVALFPAFNPVCVAQAYEEYENNNFCFFDAYFIKKIKETTTKKGWVKYPQNSDASNLASDAASHWCTSGVSMASNQLALGDFYIYHDDGRPKIAIRMQGANIAEVRGHLDNQELDAQYLAIAEKKANELDAQYFKKFKQQKFLVKLLNQETCTSVEIAWVYLFEPAGFGYGTNPALSEFKSKYRLPNVEIDLTEVVNLI